MKIARQELPGWLKKSPVPLGTAEATMARAMSYHTRTSLLFHCVFSTNAKRSFAQEWKMFLKKHGLVEQDD
jgi:hypothetical protein